VSKALPLNAGAGRLQQACERSLTRLATDHVDRHLMHWRDGTPLEVTVGEMADLVQAGKIRHWGVCTVDVDDLVELTAAGGQGWPASRRSINPGRRGIKHDLLPWCRQRPVPVMALTLDLTLRDLVRSTQRPPRRRQGHPRDAVATLDVSMPGCQRCPRGQRRTPSHRAAAPAPRHAAARGRPRPPRGAPAAAGDGAGPRRARSPTARTAA